jgi:hypothetical protein
MYRLQFFCHYTLLVVVRNLHFVRVAVAPNKTNAPLVIDADAVLARAVGTQCFQLISGRRRQIG